MNSKEIERWKHDPFFSRMTQEEVKAISNSADLEDRFCQNLEFGTGGLRGIMGAGTNRMNEYTVRKASTGLANFLIDQNADDAKTRGVAIAYDTRKHSSEFAKVTALTLCAHDIPVFLFDQPMPTPVLSYTVRQLSCVAGVVITASHNPKEYNGYKVYDEKGCQIIPRIANQLIRFVNGVAITETITLGELTARLSGLLRTIGEEQLNSFLEAVSKQAHILPEDTIHSLRVVYTPLHGTGYIPVSRILENRGYSLTLVEQQAQPDGNFSTVVTPNPEESSALLMGIQCAKQEDADIVLGTDPDCDRVGVAVLHENSYTLLTGNQIGALLVNYVLTRRYENLSSIDTVIKTIVTSELGVEIAKEHGLKTIETLTGFKYIGEQICLIEREGERRFVMGYEESYGYLIGDHARDKDAVVASMMICEMAAYYKAQNMTLLDVIQEIYRTYGYYIDSLESITLQGQSGSARIKSLMLIFRQQGIQLKTDSLERVIDYSQGIDGLPKENVVKFLFHSGSWIAVRPSGTEPKLKIYYSIRAKDMSTGNMILQEAKLAIDSMINDNSEVQ